MTAAAVLAELEELDRFLTATIHRAELGDHICMAAQPETANGSPEVLVDDGVRAGASVAGGWADHIVAALEGKGTELEIRAAIQRAGVALELEPFAREAEQTIMRGLMLGALDSVWEREHDEEIAPATFADKPGDRQFVYAPYTEALKEFEQRRVLPPAAFRALDAAAKRRAFTVAGLAKQELLDATHAELLRQIREGQAGARTVGGDTRGSNLSDFQRFAKERLESAGWTPANPSHVETIFRTNAVSAYSGGRVVEMSQPAVLAALPYWQIRTVKDARQRPTHRAADGVCLPANHPFWLHAYPPFGFNCFMPDAAIRGAVVGASRAWYAGKAVQLTTAKGRRLTVTANHPVLTSQGFVPAHALRQGMKLVSYRDEPGVAMLGARSQGNEHEAPARAEDVFRALTQALPVDLASPGADDFHGEARRFHGQVEVVGSYNHLLRHGQSAGGQQAKQLQLETPNAAALRSGAPLEFFGRQLAPARRFPRAAALTRHGFGVGLDTRPLAQLRLAAPPEFDTLLTQEASEGLTTDAELFGQLLTRGAGLVSGDYVTDVREFDFSGHVYDFETVTGWLGADSVVAGNCRCRVCARTRAWLERNPGVPTTPPVGLPDPGFESGTRSLISVPPATLQEKPAPKPVAPKPTAQLPLPFQPEPVVRPEHAPEFWTKEYAHYGEAAVNVAHGRAMLERALDSTVGELLDATEKLRAERHPILRGGTFGSQKWVRLLKDKVAGDPAYRATKLREAGVQRRDHGYLAVLQHMAEVEAHGTFQFATQGSGVARRAVAEAEQFYGSMLSKKVKLPAPGTYHVDAAPGVRAYCTSDSTTTELRADGSRGPRVLLSTSDDGAIAIHEMAHALEFVNPRALARSKAFLRTRAAGAPKRKLADIRPGHGFADSEVAWEDQFVNPYIGKDYSHATEVTSMGYQYLVEDPGLLAEKDPEMLHFILGQLAGL